MRYIGTSVGKFYGLVATGLAIILAGAVAFPLLSGSWSPRHLPIEAILLVSVALGWTWTALVGVRRTFRSPIFGWPIVSSEGEVEVGVWWRWNVVTIDGYPILRIAGSTDRESPEAAVVLLTIQRARGPS